MRLKVDRNANALYLSLTEDPAARSEQVSPGIVLDYDAQDRVIGLELLYLSKQAPGVELNRLIVEILA